MLWAIFVYKDFLYTHLCNRLNTEILVVLVILINFAYKLF